MIDSSFFVYLALMAGVTYIIRMVPLTFFNKKIKNKYVQSFLFYIPYAVLSCMTFPAVFSATSNLYSAVAGVIVAVILAFYEKSLIVVAISSCAGVLIVDFILKFI